MTFGIKIDGIDVYGFKDFFIQKDISQLLSNFIYSIHFSIVTFTTVGYGNIVPINGSLIISSIEMFTGVIMAGIWVSTLVRKMTR
jgi:voltage-gated potassium channel Kch